MNKKDDLEGNLGRMKKKVFIAITILLISLMVVKGKNGIV